MITIEKINLLKQFYTNFMRNEGKLTPEQEKNLKEVNIKLEPLKRDLAGAYNVKTNILTINPKIFDELKLELFFHELDHVRTVYKKNGERLTGITTNKGPIFETKDGEMIQVMKGRMLTEGVAEINDERVYHSFTKTEENWKEIMSETDFNEFPEHKFPSKLNQYRLNGNYIAQIAAVLGITEDDICKLIDKNQLGREQLINMFYNLTGNAESFENIEERMDLVATFSKSMLYGLELNDKTMNICNYYINSSQLMLA